MKIFCGVIIILLCLGLSTAPLLAVTRDAQTIMLSNETSGLLIDRLIAAGHQDENLYTVLQFLQPFSGGAIPASFMTALAGNPAGSDIFTAALSLFSDISNNPIGISTDGSLIVAPVYGYDYAGRIGYTTYSNAIQGLGTVRFTYTTAQPTISMWVSEQTGSIPSFTAPRLSSMPDRIRSSIYL